MIVPNCRHDKNNTPQAEGWVVSCRPHYEAAVRLNLIEHLDAAKGIDIRAQLTQAKAEIQRLTSDLNDCLGAAGVAFIRCGCGRLKLKAMYCKGCGE